MMVFLKGKGLKWLTLILSLMVLTACEGIEYSPNSDNITQEIVYELPEGFKQAEELYNTLTADDNRAALEQKALEAACQQVKLDILCNSISNSVVSESDAIEFNEVEFISNYDGDTYKFNIMDSKSSQTEQITVRALLIDSSEMKGNDGKPEPYANEAKMEAQRLLSKANHIVLQYDQGDKKDKYERHLMHVFVDGQNLQEHLLKKGLVKVAYIYEPNTTYLESYIEAEKFAKDNSLGVWGE